MTTTVAIAILICIGLAGYIAKTVLDSVKGDARPAPAEPSAATDGNKYDKYAVSNLTDERMGVADYTIKNFAPLGEKKQHISLEICSQLWSKQTTKLTIEELSQLWKSNQEESNAPLPISSDLFGNMEIIRFYRDYIDGQYFTAVHRKFVIEILKILDIHGDCPSVVNGNNEPEAALEASVYQKLGRVSLRDHVLAVARHITGSLSASPALTPKGIVSALAHDLGKIPQYHKQLYSLGDHPMISLTILQQIPGWDDFPGKNEIMEAIREHHRNSKSILAEHLRKADQQARTKELAQSFQLNVEVALPSGAAPAAPPSEPPLSAIVLQARPVPPPPVLQPIPVPQAAVPEPPAPAAAPPVVAPVPVTAENIAASDAIFGFGTAPETERNIHPGQEDNLEVPWFSVPVFMGEIRKLINVMEGLRWHAWSMTDGRIYVRTDAIWNQARKQAQAAGDTEFLSQALDKEFKARMLRAIVNMVDAETHSIDRSLVKEGYYGNYFDIKTDGGTDYQGMYTVFLADGFGVLPSELEAGKPDRIKAIKSVTLQSGGQS